MHTLLALSTPAINGDKRTGVKRADKSQFSAKLGRYFL